MRIVKVLLFDVNKTPIEEDFLTEADYLALERIKSDKTRKEKAISLMIKNKYIGNYHSAPRLPAPRHIWRFFAGGPAGPRPGRGACARDARARLFPRRPAAV